jgi:Leucine-rich repeat (LRR) protein
MMKKIILSILILSISALMFSGCGGGGNPVTPPPPDEPLESIIPETTKLVEEETIEEIVSIAEDQSTIVFEKSTLQLEELTSGDIIAMGVTENTPEGLLRKIKNITKGAKDSSEVIVETEFATLEEAIEQGEFSFDEALKTKDAKEPVCYVKGVEFIRDRSTIKDSKVQLLEFNYKINTIIYDEDNNPNTKEDNITLSGQISFNYNLLFSGKIGSPHLLKELNFQNKVKMEKNLGVTVGSSVKIFSKKIDLWTQDCGKKVVWIGWVPIVLHPKITVSTNINGEIFAKATAEISDEDTYTAGVKFDNGNWQPINSHENNFYPPSVSFSTGGSVIFGLGPNLECKVVGVAGPYCETTLYGKAIADIYTNPWWKIYVGIMAKAGVKIEIFSKTYASADLTVLDLEKIIAQADGPFSDVVEFEDPNLEQVVREDIGKPTGQLFLSDVIGIKKLDAYKRGIESLEGIQHLQNLQELNFDNNQVSDISPLANLTNLEWLYFYNNQVQDISALANLTNLEWLDFDNNQVSDISPLANLTNLEWLNFQSNQVSDISPLVLNEGLGFCDTIYMKNNYLDLTSGSQNMQDIETLINRGVDVYYEPQSTFEKFSSTNTNTLILR